MGQLCYSSFTRFLLDRFLLDRLLLDRLLLDRRFFVAVAKERFAGLFAFYRDEWSHPDIAEANGITVVLQ